MRPPTPAERARTEAGWSLEAAARWLEVKPATYRSWEKQNHFAYHYALRLAGAFGVSEAVFHRLTLLRERQAERGGKGGEKK